MIEELLRWFFDYVTHYFSSIVIFILVGYVFIRCRSFGYVYSGIVVLFLIFFVSLVGKSLPQIDTAIIIFFGTLAGGWRYLVQARSHRGGFGFPFFSWRTPQLSFFGSWFEKYDNFQAVRRFKRTYAEELAREAAKKTARGAGTGAGDRERPNSGASQHRNSRDEREQARKKSEQSSKQKQRHESFKKSRPDPPPETSSDLRTPEEILELKEGYTQLDLKTKYRKLSDKYHPDKNQHMSEVVRKEMADELVKVNLAYKKLKQ